MLNPLAGMKPTTPRAESARPKTASAKKPLAPPILLPKGEKPADHGREAQGIVLPLPNTTQNHSIAPGVRRGKNGRMRGYIRNTTETKQYLAEAREVVRKAELKPFAGYVAMTIIIYPGNNPDIDGLEKKILDVLQVHHTTAGSGMYRNDNMIKDKRTIMMPPGIHEWVEVLVEPMEWP